MTANAVSSDYLGRYVIELSTRKRLKSILSEVEYSMSWLALTFMKLIKKLLLMVFTRFFVMCLREDESWYNEWFIAIVVISVDLPSYCKHLVCTNTDKAVFKINPYSCGFVFIKFRWNEGTNLRWYSHCHLHDSTYDWVIDKHQKTAAAAAEEIAQRQKFEKKWQKNKIFNKKFDEFTAETSVTDELFRSLVIDVAYILTDRRDVEEEVNFLHLCSNWWSYSNIYHVEVRAHLTDALLRCEFIKHSFLHFQRIEIPIISCKYTSSSTRVYREWNDRLYIIWLFALLHLWRFAQIALLIMFSMISQFSSVILSLSTE